MSCHLYARWTCDLCRAEVVTDDVLVNRTGSVESPDEPKGWSSDWWDLGQRAEGVSRRWITHCADCGGKLERLKAEQADAMQALVKSLAKETT